MFNNNVSMFGSSKFSSAGSIDEYTASIHGVTLQPKIIVLRSVFGLGNLVCQPKKDRITGQYKGVRKLSQEEVKNCSYWVDPDSSVKPVMRTITNNTTLDLSQIVDGLS